MKKSMLGVRQNAILTVLVFLLSLVHVSQAELKYIFVMIGDGMGPVQRESYSQFLRATAQDCSVEAVMNSFPFQGLTTTYSANYKVTDSAASGTAIACGVKTNNGMLGLDPQNNKLVSIAEELHVQGMKVGILTSVPLDHATPAAFYAKQKGRGDSYEISVQMAQSNFEFFGGSPAAGWGDQAVKDQEHPRYLAHKNNFQVITAREQTSALNAESGKVLVSIPVVNDWEELGEGITLTDLTETAIRCLDNDKGFFMMVEGGKIDWNCHGNKISGMLAEMASFDRAIACVLEFYRQHPNETLIVVTADHETGGMRLSLGEPGYAEQFYRIDQNRRAASRLDAELEGFRGKLKPFDEVLAAVRRSYGFALLTEEHAGKLQQIYESICAKELKERSTEPLLQACEAICASLAGVQWTTGGHSDAMVLTTAIGVGAEAFIGQYDNTAIKTKILQAVAASQKEAAAK